MSIESVKIESDEDGFHLIVEGDLIEGTTPLGTLNEGTADYANFQLTGSAAVELLEAAMEQIAPWHTEGQSVLRDFEHYQRTGERPAYVPGDIFDDRERANPSA